MTRHRLHQTAENPYYIYAPNYRETSSGICVLHYLCHALNIAGHEAYVALCDIVNPLLRTPFLTNTIMAQHKEAGRVPIAVYPEVIDGNPLASPVVVRYILNREGFLNGRGVGASDSDLFFFYAEDFRDSSTEGNLLALPVIDSQLFCPPTEPVERNKNYFYLRRYPYEKVDFSKIPAGAEVLSHKDPKTLSELAELFKTAKALYSYEVSTTCTEAMLCGCPIIYLKGEHIRSLPFTSTIGNAGATLDDEVGGFERARDSVSTVREIWLEMEAAFWDQLDCFLALTQQAASDVQATLRPTVSDWLKQRTVSAVQAQLIAQHQASLPRTPSLLVIVLDERGDPEDLKTTLSSLEQWQGRSETQIGQLVYSRSAYPGDLPFGTQWEGWGGDLGTRINTLIEESGADWFMVLNAGDELIASGTLCLNLRLPQSQAKMIFCDEVHQSGTQQGAVFRPDVGIDFLLSLPVINADHWLFNREAVVALGGFDARLPHALEFDLILRMIDQHGLGCIEHVAEPLLTCAVPELEENPHEMLALARHLNHRGYAQHQIEQSSPRHYHIKYGHQAQPLVSIIIPTKDQLPFLQRCVESILEKTRYFNYEVIIVDNNSETPEALSWLAEMESIGGQKIRILRYPQPFNFSAINNLAARAAHGEYLVLLNNDTAVLRDDWLDALLNHALRPEVGIVGAKLLYPSGRVQHAGVVLGLEGPAAHPFIGMPGDAPGYMQRLVVDQNYSAVTAACLMIRKSLYEEVGGLDEEHFRVSYNDVDLCLKVGAQGHLLVWTPHAVLLHEGSVSQKEVDTATFAAKFKRFTQEKESMYAKWLPILANDPAYNHNLSFTGSGFDLDGRTQLSWRPLSWRPLPIVLAHPADNGVSASRRIIQPFKQLHDTGQVDGMFSRTLLNVVELEHYQPDTVVLQRRIDAARLDMMRKIHTFSNAFKVLDLDHYPYGLESGSSLNGSGTDIDQALSTAFGYVDRVVVPTSALADLWHGRHPDIHVRPTLLEAQWAHVERRLEPVGRPRIGCLMGAREGVDLALLEPLIKALAGEVDWVFLGAASLELRGYDRETHLNLHAQHGPAMLAGLNLDLALIPLALNVANHCRSNVQVLEYGACGIPVITTDLDGLRGNLPLIRLANDSALWLREIRALINDRNACEQSGQRLREAVRSDWIAGQSREDTWLKAWLPA